MVVSTGRGSLPAGRAAALTSQPYPPSAPAQCLAFWYQLSARTPGEHRNAPQDPGGTSRWVGVPHGTAPDPPPPWRVPWAGSLGVFVEQSGVRRKVMSVSAMEGDTWHRGHVTVWAEGAWQVRWSRVLGPSRWGGGQAGGAKGCVAAASLIVPPCPPPPAGNIRGGGSWR